MTPVVEAVARAIYLTQREMMRSFGAERLPPISDDGWKLHIKEARAAIEALAANVTDEMARVSFATRINCDQEEIRVAEEEVAALAAAIRAALA